MNRFEPIKGIFGEIWGEWKKLRLTTEIVGKVRYDINDRLDLIEPEGYGNDPNITKNYTGKYTSPKFVKYKIGYSGIGANYVGYGTTIEAKLYTDFLWWHVYFSKFKLSVDGLKEGVNELTNNDGSYKMSIYAEGKGTQFQDYQ